MALQAEHAPELANRFFDILTLQKALSKLLLEAPAAMLQIVTGLLLMGIYSPYLMAFDFFLIVSIGIVGLLGWGGVRSSIKESSEKYSVAHWLEEIARCHTSFKLAGWPVFAMQQLDDRIGAYIVARKKHFKVIVRQVFGSYLLYALASTGGLAVGGWLVIHQKLTLGQLVAAELVIVIVVSALEKLFASVDHWYDLLTALEKIGHVTDLPTESDLAQPNALQASSAQWTGVSIAITRLCFSYMPHLPVLKDISFSVQPGERLAIVGPSGQGKSTLMALLCKLLAPQSGLIQLDGVDVRDWPDVAQCRRQMALVSNTHQLFEGTILDNITMGREGLTQTDIQWALQLSALTDEITLLPQGLQTLVQPEGNNLSLGQRLRILLARGIVHRPRLLILDEVLTGIDPATKGQIIEDLLSPQYPWTVLCVTHDPAFLVRCPRVGVLSNGQWVEDGNPKRLLQQPNSVLNQLFPDTVLLSGWMQEGL
ncbi:MAG: ATP-binding cassette domain-containing protein [Vampirovibrionales bacterium]